MSNERRKRLKPCSLPSHGIEGIVNRFVLRCWRLLIAALFFSALAATAGGSGTVRTELIVADGLELEVANEYAED
jgi:hypothetical protein